MSLFTEIFGYEELPTVRPKAEPKLPWDEPFWELAPARTASSTVCNKIASAALVDEICGASDVPEIALQGFDALEEFRKAVPATVTPTTVIPAALTKFLRASRADEVAKRAPERTLAIRKIIESCLGKFRKAATADAFTRLQESSERFVAEAVILETQERIQWQ